MERAQKEVKLRSRGVMCRQQWLHSGLEVSLFSNHSRDRRLAAVVERIDGEGKPVDGHGARGDLFAERFRSDIGVAEPKLALRPQPHASMVEVARVFERPPVWNPDRQRTKVHALPRFGRTHRA